jgi:putative transposase
MSMGQISGRDNLRDTIDNMSAQANYLYHLGSTKLSLSNLSRINEEKPHSLYETMFLKLLKHCQRLTAEHQFCFNNRLYSLDATTIDLCLSVFPWANFRSSKGAVKFHAGLNHHGYLPEFVTITEGRDHDVTVGWYLQFRQRQYWCDG